MRLGPWTRTTGLRRSPVLTSVITSLTALAVTVGLAIQPGSLNLGQDDVRLIADSYDGYDPAAAEKLREDQCVATYALRKGGSSMFALAQGAVGSTPDQLHQKLRRDIMDDKTPLHMAWNTDHDSSGQWLKKVSDEGNAWPNSVSGLTYFPGVSSGAGSSIFDRTGLRPWLYQEYSSGVDLFSPWFDLSPTADDKTKAAALTIGDQQYVSGGTPQEQQAWALWKKNSGKIEPNQYFVPRVFADDARIFLSSGGFPRTAPAPGTAEFRIAVEDLKARFASCNWHDPIDPNRVLGKEVAQAHAEWQQEITGQATQRNQILNASTDATKALQEGSFSLARVLGQSWVADNVTRWQDYWAPGGAGWVGDAPSVIQVHAAQGKCLDVEGGSRANGAAVQLWTCNGSSAQNWQLIFDGSHYGLRNSSGPGIDLLAKCLDVAGGKTDDRTKIQVYTCNSSPAQQWDFNLRATSPLKNVGAGKCLDLNTFDNGKDSWLWRCNGTASQQFDVKSTGHHNDSQPKQAEFDKAKSLLTGAQATAKQQLAALKGQLATAQKAASASDTAEQAAYTIADTAGAPRGRGLLVGQQKDQVTKGTVAALQAMVAAAETAEAATRASASDSQAITQRALAQAAQVQTEFRKKAAETAELQAKAAADAAKIHRDNAKTDKETAEAKLADTLKAEANAKSAAADAHAKRLAAEAESATAKAEKENAQAKQAEAAQHQQNAQTEAGNAKTAKDKAETSEATAVDKKNAAVTARNNAKAKRDDAWDAQQKADAARAKADALDAYAQAAESDDAAKASRAAADEAAKHADEAEAAASRARGEADAASTAAAEADAAATRAEAAAKRARSDADGAQAAKAKADAAVSTATSAEADAIAASQHAAAEASTAVKLADEAEEKAKTAKSEADAASKEVPKAFEAAAKSAGYAHITAQAAEDAGNAAVQVVKPANDAIELGSPYITTDSAAGLVVLAGQGSKTIAEQQKAVADAHAKNAQEEAATAQALAEQAQADTKEAYQHAANAARYASDARGYATEALSYASDAATAASKAADSLARTVEYDRQATEDAAAANTAAGNAEGYAKEARTAADQAALDADAAHAAAAQATQDAKDARAAADRANTAATEAEQAAKDAAKDAKKAQDAADQTTTKQKNDQIIAGAGGTGGVFYHSRVELVGDPDILEKKNCNPIVHVGDCIITANVTSKVIVDLFLCTDPDIPDAQFGCPATDTLFLNTQELKPETKKVTYPISQQQFNAAVAKGFVKALTEEFVGCWDKITGAGGSWGDCGWAVFDIGMIVAGSVAIKAISDAIKTVDAALRFGIGVADAWKGLRAAGLTDAAITGIGAKLFRKITQACTKGLRPLVAPRMAAAKGTCPLQLIEYNSDEMSHLAYRYRVENGFFEADHNVAVAKVPGWNDPKTGDYVVASSGWSGHSETEILDMLEAKGVDPKTITAMYTERQPCGDCADALSKALRPEVNITYSVPYTVELSSYSKSLLATYVRRANGGQLARSAPRDHAPETQEHDAS
ncbi:ricin-type beta-trefoil lectin domain protein [Streptomyces xanthochromogenes]|uniref:ricin-type beta-trefoil lectin domain protein n=1 Tax=Streptomyces xanthochromogenes TaxID=67384 RepID=UPI0038293047